MGLQLKPDMAIIRMSGRWNADWPTGLIEAYIVDVTPDIFRQELTAMDGHVIDVIEHIQGFTFTVKSTGPMIPLKPEGNRIEVTPPAKPAETERAGDCQTEERPRSRKRRCVPLLTLLAEAGIEITDGGIHLADNPETIDTGEA